MAVKARSACRDCKAPVRWARSTASGKWMILDRDPVPGGNISLLSGSGYSDGVDRARVHGNGSVPDANRTGTPLQLNFDGDEKPLAYVDHHATCPDAKRWRR